MPTPTFAQVKSQIAKLQAQAEKVRLEEVRSIVARINEAIELYGLVASDLTFPHHAAQGARRGARKAVTRPTAQPLEAKYADGRGNVWSGRGRRPQWLTDALDAGKQLNSFLVGAAQPPVNKSLPRAGSVKSPGKAAKVAKKRAPKYRDPATGSTWTGAGSQPTWLRAGLAAGKKLSHFAIAGVARAAKKAGAPSKKRAASKRG